MSGWPEDFNFERDQTCRDIFKPFILGQLHALKELDAQRPEGTAYLFYEHAARVAKDIRKTCLHLGLDEYVANNMYWALLPHDIGKAKLSAELWDVADKPGDDLKALRRSHTTLGAEIVNKKFVALEHPFKTLMLDIMLNHHEQMDGGGYRGLGADKLSKPVRLAAIVEAFDGWSIPRPHFGDRDVSSPAVIERMRTEKAGMFDMSLFEAFAEMKLNEYKKSA